MPLPEFREFDDRIGDLSTVGEFWRWAMSDLLANSNRGVLAEYIIAKVLDVDLSHPRLEWDCYDLIYRGYKIEVKSSAYIQTWFTSEEQRSKPNYGVAKHTCWDARNDTWTHDKKRWADVYVFCIFPVDRHHHTRDILDLSQWRFYITTTRQLEAQILPETKSIGLTKVREICGAALRHTELRAAIDRLIE